MHALMQSCACRAWNAETAITGGLVADDLLSIVWNKIAALTGGSQEWPIGLGLRPWYLKVGPILLLGVACTGMPLIDIVLLLVAKQCFRQHGVLLQ